MNMAQARDVGSFVVRGRFVSEAITPCRVSGPVDTTVCAESDCFTWSPSIIEMVN